VLNLPEQTGRFNLTTEFPYYREILYRPNFADKPKGKPVVFDMDMSTGDFLSLIYLLKAPNDLINLKVQFTQICIMVLRLAHLYVVGNVIAVFFF
jgi:hypothetical protein